MLPLSLVAVQIEVFTLARNLVQIYVNFFVKIPALSSTRVVNLLTFAGVAGAVFVVAGVAMIEVSMVEVSTVVSVCLVDDNVCCYHSDNPI